MQRLHIQKDSQIVITKSVGLSGAYHVLREHYDALHERYAADFLAPVGEYDTQFGYEREYEVLRQTPFDAVVESGYGGIFGALFQLGSAAELGISVDLRRIPIRQPVIEIAEFFDMNPYLLHSSGSMVIACANAERMVMALRKAGGDAVCAGCMTKEKARIVYLDEEERFLVPARKDELLRCFDEAYVKKHFKKECNAYERETFMKS